MKVTYPHSLHGVSYGSEKPCGSPCLPACCLFAKVEMPQFLGGRGDSGLSNGWLMSTELTVGFSLCRYRTASLITLIVTWHVARITESCVMPWGKP